MKDDLLKLKLENERLNRLAKRDWLTGLYNRGATEEKINEILTGSHVGVMLEIDVDDFKRVNDRYGHLMGDRLLTSIAERLQGVFLRNDILGRIGGDEFVIFIPIKQSIKFGERRGKQVREQLRTIEVKNCTIAISVTVGYSVYQKGDDYQSLFDRADQILLKEKNKRKKIARNMEKQLSHGIEMDTLRIQNELQEENNPDGACFQSYDIFRHMYQFVERRLERLTSGACIMLLTLTDGGNNFLPYEENRRWMKILYVALKQQLRLGDVFTQYSSCQYLVMLSDVCEAQLEPISQRITAGFYDKAAAVDHTLLLHHCFPLRERTKSEG